MTIAALPFSCLDVAFADFLAARTDLQTKQKEQFTTLVRELSYQLNQGHSCLLINPQAQVVIKASGLASKAEKSPLILEQDRLYLQRYWFYETRLAQQVQQMIKREFQQPVAEPDTVLDRYFTALIDEADWQRVAAQQAIRHALCIITGGPGTGKTTTVVKILAVLQELAQQPLYIALAAPTGKAAMRLQEAISQSKATLPCSEQIKQLIPETVSTLHRLLGTKLHSPYFQHNACQPLACDLLVVDEASMVDLALMSKLVDALKPTARLILLGDKDQLASVESGAVLADLTAALPKQTLALQKSYRFEDQIKQLATLVNQQQADAAWAHLHSAQKNICILQTGVIDTIVSKQKHYLQSIKNGALFTDIYHAFSQFQTLCANRHGPLGVTEINRQVEQQLAGQNLIQLSGFWYAGRPVMITQNDAGMQLYNGDIGICLPDAQQNNKLMVYFLRPDGSTKHFLPARLPHCETVYAMTIHKSQGSEFTDVLIVLPETMSPILTKELLYTALTRAKTSIQLVVTESVFKQTVKQKVQRAGGLSGKLMQ